VGAGDYQELIWAVWLGRLVCCTAPVQKPQEDVIPPPHNCNSNNPWLASCTQYYYLVAAR